MNLTNDEFELIAEQYTEIICDGMDMKTMYQYCYDSMMDFHTRDCSGIELKELMDEYDPELWDELLDNAKHEISKQTQYNFIIVQIQWAGLGLRFTDHYKTLQGVIHAHPMTEKKSHIMGCGFLKKMQ